MDISHEDLFVILQLIVSILVAFIASSGFWLYISKRLESKSLSTKLLIGLAQDRMMYLGQKYIDRGWISKDEYENICEGLYEPYQKLGGNGLAKKIMAEIDKLPIKQTDIQSQGETK